MEGGEWSEGTWLHHSCNLTRHTLLVILVIVISVTFDFHELAQERQGWPRRLGGRRWRCEAGCGASETLHQCCGGEVTIVVLVGTASLLVVKFPNPLTPYRFSLSHSGSTPPKLRQCTNNLRTALTNTPESFLFI